jgi:hypothetical protein
MGSRWDIDNGITLCYYHHKAGMLSAHQNALWFTYWLKTNKYKLFKHALSSLIDIKGVSNE